MYMKSTNQTRMTCLAFIIPICVLLGIFYYASEHSKTFESVQPSPIKNFEDKKQSNHSNRDGTASKIAPTVENYDGWKIIYNEKKLRAEVESIHNLNYKVRDGDKCSKTLPNFILVGVDKCGTRELMDFLSIHPKIITKNDPYTLQPTDKQVVKNGMPCKYHDQLSGFKMHTRLTNISTPGEIYKLNSNVKIMAIIREPISRVMSRLTFVPSANPKKRVIKDSKAMKTYIQKAINETINYNKPNKAKVQSLYDVGVERYLKKFKEDQVLVIETGEFQKNPVKVLKTIEQFLGISSFISDQHFVLKSKKQFYCIRKTLTESKTMVCYQSNRGRKLIELDEEDKDKLATYFKPHNENLFHLLGRRFDW